MSSKPADRRRKRRADAQAKSAKRRTPGQTSAMADLRQIAARHPLVLAADDLHVGKGQLQVRLRISTADIERVQAGLPISSDHEDVELWFDDAYPNRPPTVLVRHIRFVGFPHVLVGYLLCIYLDTDREWHPALGVDGVVARLIEWLRDAAAGRFDSRAALYHPIGGLPPSPRVPGTLVIRHSDPAAQRKLVSRATITPRTDARGDLTRWSGGRDNDGATAVPALVLRTTHAMPFGLVNVRTLGELADRLERAGGPDATAIAGAAARLLPQLPVGFLHMVVEVAHPDDARLSYLACAIAAVPPPLTSMQALADHLAQLPIGWLNVSDERPEISTRRDSRRPTASFEGKSIELWGCGGLGSWMAEFICRAGAKSVILRDTGTVKGGLLVRQNYVEDDVGRPKAEQLAARLRSVADDLDVEAMPGSALDALGDGFTSTADILIDATINVTVAARLDEWARSAATRPLMAQVATDPRTATLGMLVVASPDLPLGPASVDDATWGAVKADASLERFHGFWTPTPKSEQLVPALGCSTPTFHGSAADLACLAGSLVSLLAAHIGVAADGTHLIESSHARGPSGGGHHFIAFNRS